MKIILQFFRSFTTGLITIPVNFLLKIITGKTEGPLGATAVMFFFLLFVNFAMVIIMLFFHKNLRFLELWAQCSALINILTLQYILILPIGAILFQVWSWFRHGWHIDSRVLVFLTLIFPIGGGIALGLGFSILGGLRYTTMPENNIVIPALSAMRDLHGAPWFSLGYFTDIIKTIFPFTGATDSLILKLLKIYFLSALLWFSLDVWIFYYGKNNGENSECRIKLKSFTSKWKELSILRKTASLSLAFFLASISSALLYNSVKSFAYHYRISYDGAEIYAIPDPSYMNNYKSGSYSIKYSFTVNNKVYDSIQFVDYNFHSYVKKKLKQIPVKYLITDPSQNRILYSQIYKIHPDFDNSYGSSLLVFIIGLGFFAGALYAFPGMAIRTEV